MVDLGDDPDGDIEGYDGRIMSDRHQGQQFYHMSVQKLFGWGMKRMVPQLIQPLDNGGPILNLGAGNARIPWNNWFAPRVVDLDLPGWNANSGQRFAGIGDGACDGIYAFHLLEHVDRPIDVLWDCQRILDEGAPLTIVVPYYNSQMMAHDLTHKNVFCEDTWKVLFGTPYYNGQHAGEWRFNIGFNMIVGVVERNMCLMTQLIKTRLAID